MTPRFMERIQRQSVIYQEVFSYPRCSSTSPTPTHVRTASAASSTSQHTAPQPSPRAPAPAPPLPHPRLEEHTTVRDRPALPADPLILVLGSNSWQDLYVADHLLKQGYRVRGTARDLAKAAERSGYFKRQHGPGRYISIVVPDIISQDALTTVIRGCCGVVHVASGASLSSDPHGIVTSSIAGALDALAAIVLKHGGECAWSVRDSALRPGNSEGALQAHGLEAVET